MGSDIAQGPTRTPLTEHFALAQEKLVIISVFLSHTIVKDKGDSDDEAPGEGVGGGDGGGDDGHAKPDEEDEPTTKAELYKMYKGRGPVKMQRDLLGDRSLQQDAIIFCAAGNPLELEYGRDLATMKEGPEAQAEWAANRADMKTWWPTVTAILNCQQDQELMSRLGLTMPVGERTSANQVFDWMQDEIKVLKFLTFFTCTLAMNVLWSNVIYAMCLPQLGAAYMLPEGSKARVRADQLVTAVVQAEQIVYSRGSRPPPKALQDCLQDLGWHKQQLPREMMALIVQKRYLELKRLALKIWRASHTTRDLESTFAKTRFEIERSCKNKKANGFTKWLYAVRSTYFEDGGLPQILPEASDWHQVHSPAGKEDKLRGLKELFHPSRTLMPEGKPTPSALQIRRTKWKSSGPLSHQTSGAAGAYLIQDGPEFKNVGMAWAGRV